MSSPPLFLQLLADRKLNPGATELRIGRGDMNFLKPLFEDEKFLAFTAAFPCFVGADLANRLPPALLNGLLEAGCQILQSEAFYQPREKARTVVPSNAHWLSGDWYLAAPANTSATQVASRTLSLKLLNLVSADADTCDIETVFRQDPVLAYQLLRLVNSLGVGVGKHISSFAQAILILGRHQLKRWLNLMLFAASRDDYRSPMLLARVVIHPHNLALCH